MVIHKLLQRNHPIHRTDIGLEINVIRTGPDAVDLSERQLQLEHPDAKIQRVLWQLHQPADVDELEICFAQATICARPARAEVVVDPKCNVASKVAGRKEAERTSLEVGGGYKRRQGSDRS